MAASVYSRCAVVAGVRADGWLGAASPRSVRGGRGGLTGTSVGPVPGRAHDFRGRSPLTPQLSNAEATISLRMRMSGLVIPNDVVRLIDHLNRLTSAGLWDSGAAEGIRRTGAAPAGRTWQSVSRAEAGVGPKSAPRSKRSQRSMTAAR